MKDIDHMIAVLQAFKKGKAIQSRYRPQQDIDVCWIDATEPSWDWDTFDYRVKPEPRRIWVNMYVNERTPRTHFYTLEEAQHAASPDCIESVMFVEAVKE